MRSPMDENTYLGFYTSTVLGCSKAVINNICLKLMAERMIVCDSQIAMEDLPDAVYFENKRDQKRIITETTSSIRFAGFYEEWEFSKLYKYSVPLFYELHPSKDLKTLFVTKGVKQFEKGKYSPIMVLNTTLRESDPMFWEHEGKLYIKFVLQKSYYKEEPFEQVDYRYPVVLFFDPDRAAIEIRYDAVRYSSEIVATGGYDVLVEECIKWMQEYLGLELFKCEHKAFIPTINDKNNSEVIIYRQMMEMSSGGSAELTASEGRDYCLPFIGEIRELIEENGAMFDDAEDIKSLLLNYLADKEATANYPYVYVKWVEPVESQSYVVKVTFDYLKQKYTLLQHITGMCKDLGMRRMNNAIQYLCDHGSFVKGEKV